MADLKPSGKYVKEDLHYVGGTPAVIKYLLEKGLLDGSCLTVTGKTRGRKPERSARASRPGRSVSASSKTRSRRRGHIRIMRGNLAPEGAVAKITGKEGLKFTGPAKCYDSRRTAARAGAEEDRQGRRRRSSATKVPRVARECRRCSLRPRRSWGRAWQGRGADDRRPLLRRLARLHRGAHHARGAGGGPIALVENGDRITIDAAKIASRWTWQTACWQPGGPSGRPRPTSSPAGRCTSTSRP